MPAKCGGCGKFVAAIDTTRCTKCGGVYHRSCVGLPAKGPSATIAQCPECRKNVRRDNKAETPVRGLVPLSTPPPMTTSAPLTPTGIIQLGHPTTPPSATAAEFPQDLGTALKMVVEELRTLRFEVMELRKDVAQLIASNDSCQTRMDGIESRLEVLEKREGCAQSADSRFLESVVEQLKQDLNDRDQELMANDVIITNILRLKEKTQHISSS